LNRVLTDQELRTRLIEGGLKRAREFTFEKFTRERIDAIRSRLPERQSAKG
jgi:hypothetical protein